MIVCKKCGNEMSDGAKFCSKCGESLNDISAGTKDIIISAKNGDPEAFGKLYELYRKSGISIAKQYVKNDTDAEDMYQDAFLKAMENIERFDENKEFGPWLNTIIANTCKDFLGKKRPMNFTDMSDEENEFVDTIASTDESSLPESVYVRKEMLQIVDGIVEMLPDEQKEATLLFYFKDYSVKQVAEYQHVSEDTVKSRLNYSRKKIEQATKEYEKKHGIKICVSSVIPAILVLYFKNSVHASQLDASLGALSASNGLSGAGAGAKLGSGAIKAGTAGKTVAAAKTVAAWKIAAIAGAGIIAAAGVGFAVHHFVTSDDRDEIVAEAQEESDEELSSEERTADGYINDEGYYVFGTYEQDGVKSNGPEPIEWEILDVNENGTLLISRYVLDCVPYNTTQSDVTWETCSLRDWLNDDFINSAFTADQQALIPTVNVVNADNEQWGTPGGNNTNDKIFCLSVDEIFKYFSINNYYDFYHIGSSQELITPATEYAEKNGVLTHKITRNEYNEKLKSEGYTTDCIGQTGAWWWMRSPGCLSNFACAVHYLGSGGAGDSTRVNNNLQGVRPAFYISKNILSESETQTESDIQEDTGIPAAEVPEEALEDLEEAIKNAQVGDIIEIGRFEQDEDETNGPEPIQWRVIGTEDGRVLLMSEYILMRLGDTMEMDSAIEPGDGAFYSWAECGLRTYLNGEFYESAFTDGERELIAETELKTTLCGSVLPIPAEVRGAITDRGVIQDEEGNSFNVAKLVTTDRIFIPDYYEEFTRYLKVEDGSNWRYGTYLLTQHAYQNWSYPSSGPKYPATLMICPEDVKLDESMIGEGFYSYIMRNGGYGSFDIGRDRIPYFIENSAFYVVTVDDNVSFMPYSWYNLSKGDGIGVRPMMWVYAK